MVKYPLPREVRSKTNTEIKQYMMSVRHLLDEPAVIEGKEFNSLRKSWDEDYKLRFVACVPTKYTAGVNNMGLNILYESLNKDKDVICERSFLPEPKLIRSLERDKFPLGFSLESKRPFHEFDIVGFSSYFELQFVPAIRMLQMSGIPVYAEERTDEDPLVIIGGLSSYSIAPTDLIYDMVFVGDGEIQFKFFKRKIPEYKSGKITKDELLMWFATHVPGCFVPKFYEYTFRKNPDGTDSLFIDSIKPKQQYVEAPERITKAYLDLASVAPFYRSVLPAVEGAFIGYNSVEVARGCHSSCRFCMVGSIHKPYREHDLDKIKKAISMSNSVLGTQSLTPYSLNYSAFSQQAALAVGLTGDNQKSATTASQRADSFCPDVADVIAKNGTRNTTLAFEAGSQRMRDVINKEVQLVDVYKALFSLIDSGYSELKIYMISNLPFEQEEDRMEIINVLRLIDNYRRYLCELTEQVNYGKMSERDAEKRAWKWRRENTLPFDLEHQVAKTKEAIDAVLPILKRFTDLETGIEKLDASADNTAQRFALYWMKNVKEKAGSLEDLISFLSNTKQDFEGVAKGITLRYEIGSITAEEALKEADESSKAVFGDFMEHFSITTSFPEYDSLRKGSRMVIRVSYTEFTAKPYVALQWADVSDWTCKLEEVYKELSTINVKYRRSTSGINHFFLQALNRLDRRFVDALVDLVCNKGLMCDEALYIKGKSDDDIEDIVSKSCLEYTKYPMIEYLKEMPLDTYFPWYVFNVGYKMDNEGGYLGQEYRKAMKAIITPSCFTKCTQCGICTDEELVKMGATFPVYHRLQTDMDKEAMLEAMGNVVKEQAQNKIILQLRIEPYHRDFPISKFKTALRASFASVGFSLKGKVDLLSDNAQWDHWVFGTDIAVLRTSKPVAMVSKKQLEQINARLNGVVTVEKATVYPVSRVKSIVSLAEKVMYYGKVKIQDTWDTSEMNFEDKKMRIRQKQKVEGMNRVTYMDKDVTVSLRTKCLSEEHKIYEVFLTTDIDTNAYDVLRVVFKVKNKRELLMFPFERKFFFKQPYTAGIGSSKCKCGSIKEIDMFDKPLGATCISCMIGEGIKSELRRELVTV